MIPSTFLVNKERATHYDDLGNNTAAEKAAATVVANFTMIPQLILRSKEKHLLPMRFWSAIDLLHCNGILPLVLE